MCVCVCVCVCARVCTIDGACTCRNTCHRLTKLGSGQEREPACRNMAEIPKFKTKSVGTFAFVSDTELYMLKSLHVKNSMCKTLQLLVCVCVCVHKCAWRCLCVDIYVYMLKINTGYITPCDPAAHLDPASLRSGLTRQSLSLAEMLQGQLR